MSHNLAGKWIFLFYKKPFLMDKTRTVGQKWLANELDLHFLILKKCTKDQSNRLILSKVIVLTNYKFTDRHTADKQTDTFEIGLISSKIRKIHIQVKGFVADHIISMKK